MARRVLNFERNAEKDFDDWVTQERLLYLMQHYPQGLTEGQIEEKLKTWYTTQMMGRLEAIGLVTLENEPIYHPTETAKRMMAERV